MHDEAQAAYEWCVGQFAGERAQRLDAMRQQPLTARLETGLRRLLVQRHPHATLPEGDRRGGACRTAADDHDVDDPIVQERGVPVGGFPLAQDVLLEADRVGERVHREGVLGSALGSEEVDLRTERRH